MGTRQEMMVKIGRRIAEIRNRLLDMPDKYYSSLAEVAKQYDPALYKSVRQEMMDVLAPVYCGKGEEGRKILAEIDRGAKLAGRSRTQYILDLVRADLDGSEMFEIREIEGERE